jgi:hypothetical protein
MLSKPRNVTMHLLRTTLAVVVLTIVSLQAGAASSGSSTRYRWKDAHGVVQYTDTLPAEALQLGYDVVDAQGLVLRHVDRPKSAEEKKADAAAASAQATAKQRALEATKADQQLLVAYASDKELAAAQKAKLDGIDLILQNVRVSQADQEKSLNEQLAHASTFERDNKPVPASVKQQIEILRKNIETQNVYLANKLKERAETELKGEAELAHYKELRAKEAAASAEHP